MISFGFSLNHFSEATLFTYLCLLLLHKQSDSLVAQWKRIHLLVQETQFQSLGCKDSLEKEMAAYFSILAWKIPRTEGTGGLYSRWSQKADVT